MEASASHPKVRITSHDISSFLHITRVERRKSVCFSFYFFEKLQLDIDASEFRN